MDPMMGNGIIPIEAACNWENAYYIGGDIAPEKLHRALENVKEANVIVNVMKWNVAKLPFRTSLIDKIISDIPFGAKKVHSNNQLYPLLFREITRITKGHGRAVILTIENALMDAMLEKNYYWNVGSIYQVESSGLQVNIYVLERTTLALT